MVNTPVSFTKERKNDRIVEQAGEGRVYKDLKTEWEKKKPHMFRSH